MSKLLNTTISKKDNAKLDGQHVISKCQMLKREAIELEIEIEKHAKRRKVILERKARGEIDGETETVLLLEHWNIYNELINRLHKKYLLDQVYVHNVTTTLGRSAIVARLAGGSASTGQINYGALGDDATAELIGDTSLGNEVFRKALSSGSSISNAAYLENFYNATEVVGTFEEYAFFMDATGVADSGNMSNRFTETLSKSIIETINVQSIITLNDA